MARKKKYYNLMDKNATKTRDLHFRVTPLDAMYLEKLRYKTNLSKTDIFREVMRDYYKRFFQTNNCVHKNSKKSYKKWVWPNIFDHTK